jgi:Cdc6-like AAA superfamily ATPase
MSDVAIRMQKLFLSGEVFTPSAPINRKELFAGRLDQIKNVINAINQAGQHVIIYGERGVGKTSLVTVLQEFLPSGQGIISVRVNADPTTTFESLFRSILSEVRLTYTKLGTGFIANSTTTVKGLDEFIDKKRGLNPNELRFLFRSLGQKAIVIIDEFDRVKDTQVKQLIADTLKNFSDYSVDTTFILVGVADTVDELITEHQSTERAIAQIPMPRMSPTELSEIASNGFEKLGLNVGQDIKNRLILLSQGLPHYVHLLSLYAAQAAIETESDTIGEDEFDIAIAKAIEHTEQTVRGSYYKAVSSPQQGNKFSQVLLACALAKNDSMGYFAASDARTPLQKITGKSYEINSFARHLKEFCGNERGQILRKIGQLRKYRYRFIDPLLEPFVILKGLSDKDITNKDL